MSDVLVVREWDADVFHRRVTELEAAGYIARRESYAIMADMDPETGSIAHLHTVEMDLPSSNEDDG
jgi:hypothetical protein